MIHNEFDNHHEYFKGRVPELNMHWPLGPEVFQKLWAAVELCGRPSKVFKYDDYGAVHYTYLAKDVQATEMWANRDVYKLTDYLMIFFPGDHDIGTYQMAHGKFDIETTHPSYYGAVKELLEDADLAELYKEIEDSERFAGYLHSRASREKVRYDEHNNPMIDSSMLFRCGGGINGFRTDAKAINDPDKNRMPFSRPSARDFSGPSAREMARDLAIYHGLDSPYSTED